MDRQPRETRAPLTRAARLREELAERAHGLAGRLGRPLPRFASAALLALAAFWTVYVGFIQTEAGQRIENLGLSGAALQDATEVERSLTNLSQISIVSFGVAIVLVALMALLRRRWDLAIATMTVMSVSIVIAEVLKAVLPRPHLVDGPAWLLVNTFPSGHATIAVAIGIGALIAAPDRLRWLVLPLAAGYAGIIAQAVQIAGWHRLSGTLGGVFLATAVACLALAVLASRGLVVSSPVGGVSPRIRTTLVLVAGAAVILGAVVAIVPIAFPLLRTPPGAIGAFIHTALQMLGTGLTILTLVLFAALIEPFTLGTRAPPGPGPADS